MKTEMTLPAVEDLPEVDMAAVLEERKAIAAKAFPNNSGNYTPRAVRVKQREERRARREQQTSARRVMSVHLAFIAAIAAAGAKVRDNRRGAESAEPEMIRKMRRHAILGA